GAPVPRTLIRADAGRLLYLHPEHGYAATYAPEWRLDTSLEPVTVRLEAGDAVIELFVEPQVSASSYLGYGNRPILEERSGMTLLASGWQRLGPHRAYILHWLRPPLPLEPDLRRTWEAHIEHGGGFISVMLRATDAALPARLAEAQRFVADLTVIDPQLQPGQLQPGRRQAAFNLPRAAGRSLRPLQEETPLRWRFPEQGIVWGIFDPSLQPQAPDWPALRQLEQRLGTHFQLLMTYQRLGSPFPSRLVTDAARQGRLVMLTLQSWEPMPPAAVYTEAQTLHYRLLAGEFDAALRRYARDAAATGLPFFFRLDNEMNGDWSPWGAYHYGKDSSLYRAAWRHVYRIFQEEGAVNAIWVWNPHDRSFPPFAWNHHALYYPGDAFVDIVGITPYNEGNAYPSTRWRPFVAMLDPVYAEYMALYGHKPFMITEFAAHEGGGDKAAWIRSVQQAWPRYPNIKFAVWWNHTDDRRRYRIDSSPEALEAFREVLHHPGSVRVVQWRAPAARHALGE
ncbi:MAG TPA: glycosyl hydrolase, partial [Bacillota bacterium]